MYLGSASASGFVYLYTSAFQSVADIGFFHYAIFIFCLALTLFKYSKHFYVTIRPYTKRSKFATLSVLYKQKIRMLEFKFVMTIQLAK